jgi:hypothetical protein
VSWFIPLINTRSRMIHRPRPTFVPNTYTRCSKYVYPDTWNVEPEMDSVNVPKHLLCKVCFARWRH